MIAVKDEQKEEVFNEIVKTAELDKPGKGFAFIHSIENAIGFI
jgi:nitrogen regulatory protein PII